MISNACLLLYFYNIILYYSINIGIIKHIFSDVMSANNETASNELYTVDENTKYIDVIKLMFDNKISHLPVMSNDKKRATDIITTKDILRHIIDDNEYKIKPEFIGSK